MRLHGTDVRIVSFYQSNIPQEVVGAQKSVFRAFALSIEQVLTTLPHGAAIDLYLASQSFDVLIIFDIDCVPLSRQAVLDAVDAVTTTDCVYGAAQNANHLPGSADYVAPAFFCISRRTFDRIGRPSFSPTARGDVAAELTYRAREANVETRLLAVTHVHRPLWRLADGTMFGHGTTYANRVFHAFEVRKQTATRELFLDTCRVLSETKRALSSA